MTAGWAAELAAGGDADLVARIVRLAASGWVTPERLRRAVVPLLVEADVKAEAVVAGVEAQADVQHRLADPATTERTARALLSHGAVVRVAAHPGYPPRLEDAWPELGAPLWLFVRASEGVLPDAPAAAVVGTRQPTLDGARTAREIGALLARHRVTVVSGMARGIDQAAHMGAVETGGSSVGVLGTGFGVDYPRHDGGVRDAVAASGALVTEFAPDTPPHKPGFLWRNRIISALADVTVVVEGKARSGALHTARMAAAQGRDVMAVPGPVRAATSRAPLDLIRDGAQPLTRLEDLLDVLRVDPVEEVAVPAPRVPANLGPVATSVLPLLGAVPAAPAALAAATRAPVGAVMAAVAELTRQGLAAATPRGVVRVNAGGR
ncbi:MAG: DNA-protecting protein DprA [Nitriliruptorales bacterium]|nr:DNA-protecting protein DprA [Nitriliruptorales bacterium]